MADPLDQPRWIWHCQSPHNAPNQFVEFRREIDLPSAMDGVLRVSVDTDFVAWVNGMFVGCGQFTDFPQQRTYSEMPVRLQAGRNVIAILAHYCGEDHFSYLPGDAGLWFELLAGGKTVAVSDEQTRCRPSPAYRREETARFTQQRGFTFHFDAAGDDGWTAAQYEPDASWRPANCTSCNSSPTPRPVKMLEIRSRTPARIIAQGLLKRVATAGQTVAQQMQNDYLSARRSWELFDDSPAISSILSPPVKISPNRLDGGDGAYLVLDLHREECGFIELELDSADRCVIDVAVGEHLDDLRVRSHIGGRNFASRYVARAGKQLFTHHIERYAGRYMQLHVTQLRGALELKYAGLLPVEYPVEFAGEFDSSDSLHNQIWQTARRTLHLCMFEHYEDCPAREQGLYANDSRNQMLAGYYAFGNYDFARASLDLLSRSTGDDGYQELCAPMKCPITIPGFTLIWFLAMNDYLTYSGDRAFIAEKMPQMKRMAGGYLATLADGLFPCPTGERYWHFYDWAAGLDGTRDEDCRKFAVADAPRFDAPLNFLLVMALEALANMSEHLNDASFTGRCRGDAQLVRSAAERAFWDAKRQAFRTYLYPTTVPAHFAELTQSLAILAGAGDENSRRSLRAKLMQSDNGMVPTTLSQSLYKFEALLLDAAAGPFVRDQIARQWGPMLFAGATSFWETLGGGWDFHHAGSLCHGWSATPVYFYGAYGLGIKPVEPGFSRLHVQPAMQIPLLSGKVPTPRGNVELSLRQGDDQTYSATLRTPPASQATMDRARVSQCRASE